MRIESESLKSSAILHGFFTREGGVSEGLYASLNCGTGSEDAREKVKENILRVRKTFSDDAPPLCKLWQIHSADVVTVTQPWALDQSPKADAMVTNRPHIILGILTADCCPVLFADAKNKVIGAAHAGWKGALGGVLERTIDAMLALGAEKKFICAAIGPSIAQTSYEVGAEFYAQFANQSALYGSFFQEAKKLDHFLFNLPAFVKFQLMQYGLQGADGLAMDTYVDEMRFFSYRRMCHRGEADYGRQISAIMLEAEK